MDPDTEQGAGWEPYSWKLRKKDGGSQPHYDVGRIQPIDLILEQKLNFPQGCIVKYICRYPRSETPLRDLIDARNYLDMLIDELQKEQQLGGDK